MMVVEEAVAVALMMFDVGLLAVCVFRNKAFSPVEG